MATIAHRQMKRCYIENDLNFPISKNLKRLRDYQDKHDWPLEYRKKVKRSNKIEDEEQQQQYHCQVYLKLFPSTLKCSIDVIVKSINKLTEDNDDPDSILIAKTRIPKTIKPGLI